MNTTIGFTEILRLIKDKWKLLLVCFLVGLGGAYAWSTYVMVPHYQSTTRILVNRSYAANQRMELQDIETNIQLINTYRDIIEDPVILEEVRETIGSSQPLDELKNNIEVHIQQDSQIFAIQGTDTDPQRAALLTNTVAEVFQESIGDILPVDNVAILSPAPVNEEPISPNVLLNLIIGAAAGTLIGFLYAIGSTVINTKIADELEVMELLGWVHLGSLTEVSKKDMQPSPTASYRELQTKPEKSSVVEGGHRHV